MCDLTALLVDISNLDDDGAYDLGWNIYCEEYCSQTNAPGEMLAIDGSVVKFFRDRYEHAFRTTPDRYNRPHSKERVRRSSVERIRWIRAALEGQVNEAAAFEQLPANGRTRPFKRLFVIYKPVFYIIWLQPMKDGSYSFSSAYTVTRDHINGYTRDCRTIWRPGWKVGGEKSKAP